MCNEDTHLIRLWSAHCIPSSVNPLKCKVDASSRCTIHQGSVSICRCSNFMKMFANGIAHNVCRYWCSSWRRSHKPMIYTFALKLSHYYICYTHRTQIVCCDYESEKDLYYDSASLIVGYELYGDCWEDYCVLSFSCFYSLSKMSCLRLCVDANSVLSSVRSDVQWNVQDVFGGVGVVSTFLCKTATHHQRAKGWCWGCALPAASSESEYYNMLAWYMCMRYRVRFLCGFGRRLSTHQAITFREWHVHVWCDHIVFYWWVRYVSVADT